MSSSLQIQRLTAGSVASNATVIFDSTKISTGNINYDNMSGTITLQESGIFEFVW